MLWDTLVFTQTLKRKEGRNSYATPTPVTDGARVYASFGDGSFVAVDVLNGKVVWTNRDYPFYGQHGLGTSLVLYRDLVIMARDGSNEGDDKALGWQTPWDQSFVIALDARTGRQRWKASRGLSRIAHVTPIVARIGTRDVLISPAGDVVQAFDLGTGARLWSVREHRRGRGAVAGDGRRPRRHRVGVRRADGASSAAWRRRPRSRGNRPRACRCRPRR